MKQEYWVRWGACRMEAFEYTDDDLRDVFDHIMWWADEMRIFRATFDVETDALEGVTEITGDFIDWLKATYNTENQPHPMIEYWGREKQDEANEEWAADQEHQRQETSQLGIY